MKQNVCVGSLIALTVIFASDAGFGKDSDDDDGSSKASTSPIVYLDLNTAYTAVSAGSLALGFRNTIILPTLSRSSAQSVAVAFPVTVDVTDQVSLYGGLNTFTSRADMASWTSLTVDSWFVGFQALVYEQNGGLLPSVTLQSTLTRSIGGSLSATGTSTVAELGYALNEDETKGLLGGIKYSAVFVDTNLLTIEPAIVGYLGGYYQWPNNWKLTGRAGVQSFGGAHLANLVQVKPFTLPIIRLDLDRMDDNDNRLFGVTAEVAWTPNLTAQMTLRTPLYLTKR